MTADRTQTAVNPWVLPLAAVAGGVLAVCIGMGVRLERGYPPGVRPDPWVHLLDKPALAFEVEGLEGGSVSLRSGDATVGKRYRIRGFPTTLWIDGQGWVRHAATGVQSVKQVLAAWKGDRDEKL